MFVCLFFLSVFASISESFAFMWHAKRLYLLLLKLPTVKMDWVEPEEENSPTEANAFLYPSLVKYCKEYLESFSSDFHLKLLDCSCVKDSLLTPVRQFGRGGEETCLPTFCVLCQIRHFEQKYEEKADVRECLEAGTWAYLLWLAFVSFLLKKSDWIVKWWEYDWTQTRLLQAQQPLHIISERRQGAKGNILMSLSFFLRTDAFTDGK